MGLFSSEYRTSVSTSVSRAVEDKQLPQTLKGAVIQATLKEGNVTDYITASLIDGLVIKTDRMYYYAKKSYPTGLPSKSAIYAAASEKALIAALRPILGEVSIDYANYGPLNLLHTAWVAVVNTYKHNSSTNELLALSATKGFKVYLKDLIPVVQEATLEELGNGSLDFWGISANSGFTHRRVPTTDNIRGFTPLLVDPAATSDYVKMVYTWEKVTITKTVDKTVTYETESREIMEESLIIPFPDFVLANEYIQVRYSGGDGLFNYFTYAMRTGRPSLDLIYAPTPYEGVGSYFPNIFFRRGGGSMSTVKDSEDYKASIKMMKYLGMDYEAILKTIDSNPDASKVEQAFMTMATPAKTDKPLQARYLFDFFNDAYTQAGGKLITQSTAYFKLSPVSIVIQDKYSKCALGFSGIHREVKGGVIGKVGFCTTELGGFSRVETVTQPVGNEGGTQQVEVTVETPVHYYRKQIAERSYYEVQVLDLSMSYFIKNGYSTVGTKEDPILLVPIDYKLVKEYSLLDRETLYASSMHYVFNAYQEQEVQWYQTGVFQTLLTIAAVVWTVYSMGSDGGQMLSLALAGSSWAAQQLIMMAIEAILTNYLVGVVASLIIKAVGIELAFFIAIAAIVYGGYKIAEAGGVKGAPFAEKLLFAANSLTSGISKQIKLAYNDLRSEYASFEAYAKEKAEELEKANDLLSSSTLLSPFVIFGEKPGDYYNRTVHMGNVGVLSVAAIGSYCDTALALPTFADSTEFLES